MRRLGTITTILVFASFVAVLAKSSYLSSFNSKYGTTDKTLDTCTTCHINGFDRNPYGADVETELLGGSSITVALAAIEGTDSDGDGDTNIAEINAGTFPGNPSSSLPVEGATWGKIKALYD